MKRFSLRITIIVMLLLLSVLLNGCGGSSNKTGQTQAPTDTPTPTPTQTKTATATPTPNPTIKTKNIYIELNDDLEPNRAALETTVTFNGSSKKFGRDISSSYFSVEQNREYEISLESDYYKSQKYKVFIQDTNSSSQTLEYYMTSIYSRLQGRVKIGSNNVLTGAKVIIPELGLETTTSYNSGYYQFVNIKPNTSFSIKVIYKSTERVLATNISIKERTSETKDLVFE